MSAACPPPDAQDLLDILTASFWGLALLALLLGASAFRRLQQRRTA